MTHLGHCEAFSEAGALGLWKAAVEIGQLGGSAPHAGGEAGLRLSSSLHCLLRLREPQVIHAQHNLLSSPRPTSHKESTNRTHSGGWRKPITLPRSPGRRYYFLRVLEAPREAIKFP